MKSSSHPGGQLLNIVSGEMVSEEANPHEAVDLGTDLIHKFRSSWPEGFRVPITKSVILMDTKRNSVKIGDHRIYDQSFIYARTCGLMMNNPDIKMENCLVTEMAPNPSAYFNENGTMRTCTSKYLLRVALEERISDRLAQKCNTVVYDVSALLWTITWPNEGNPLAVYIKAFQVFVLNTLSFSQRGVFVFDCYFDLSPKANARYQRQGKEGSSRTYVLKPDMITPPRTCILGVTDCKKQLNVLLSDALLDPEFYKQATSRGQTLIVAGVEDFPIEITNGVRIDRKDIDAHHEEADLIIAQQAIISSKEGDVVSVVSDDTGVFVLLLHFYVLYNCSSNMYMSSFKRPKSSTPSSIDSSKDPVTSHEERTVIDIKKTATKHVGLSQHILQIHALSGADTVAPNFGIGKKTALNTLVNFNKKMTQRNHQQRIQKLGILIPKY